MSGVMTAGPWEAVQNAYGSWFVYGGEERSNGLTKYRDLVCGGNSHDTLKEMDAKAISLVPTMVSALIKIAALGDERANEHFVRHGSYELFDEPGSVQIARECLDCLARYGEDIFGDGK